MGHAEREHALLSASSAHRWLACTPSARLEDGFPDTTSGAAIEGTLAHELAELKVRNYFYEADFSKRKMNNAIKKLKEKELWQDEMMGYTDEYLDYIKSTSVALAYTPYASIEKKVDFSSYVPDGFGTADLVLLSGQTLIVIDFKYGKSPDGRVSAVENPQMLMYALGAYSAYKLLYSIKHVKLVIVQPRLPDGISEWSCTMDEVLEFGEYVKCRAKLAFAGEGDFNPNDKACKYCRARGQCRARADENVKLAFMVDKKPPLLSAEEAGTYLTQGQDVAKWLKDLQDWVLAECLAGKEVPGWKAIEGRGSRDWTDMDAAFEKLTESGVADEAILFERKPLTLAQIEKMVGKKDFEAAVSKYIVKNPGKPALVKEFDRREAITNKISAAEAFK